MDPGGISIGAQPHWHPHTIQHDQAFGGEVPGFTHLVPEYNWKASSASPGEGDRGWTLPKAFLERDPSMASEDFASCTRRHEEKEHVLS